MAIKIAHIADVHLGMENYGRIDPETGLNSRLLDFHNSLDYAVDYSLDNDVDLAIFAGDAYKTRDPSPTQQRMFISSMKKFADREVPLVLLAGNHDLPNAPGKAHTLDVLNFFGDDKLIIADQPKVHLVSTKSGEVQVAALPYLVRSTMLSKDKYKDVSSEEVNRKIAEVYERLIAKLKDDLVPDLPTILTAHLSVAGASLGWERNIILGADPMVGLGTIADPAFDYVALGHIHKHQDLNPKGQPPVVYPGSLERVDFGESNDRKGFCIAEVERGRSSYTFVETPARRFVVVRANADSSDPTREIVKAIKRREGEIEGAVVKVIYTLPKEKSSSVNEKELRGLLKKSFMVASITAELVGEETRSRHPLLTEEIKDPLEALAHYLETKDGSKDRSSDLLKYARGLLTELNGE